MHAIVRVDVVAVLVGGFHLVVYDVAAGVDIWLETRMAAVSEGFCGCKDMLLMLSAI